MTTINDINIFILSFNRGKYIKEAIESLMVQTIGLFKITILDNGSIDNTKEIIESLNNKNIIFIGSDKNNGAMWNIQRANNLSSKKYTIMFHDDDIIHPKYLEYVIKVLNEYPDISLVSSGMKTTADPDKNKWKTYSYNPVIFNNLSEFAGLVYLGFPLNFATIVYKTDFLKKESINFDKYGKISDRPFVFDCVKNGKIALLLGQYVQYRIHPNQDSQNNKSGPFANEVLALHKKYKSLIYRDNFLLPKMFFLINFYRYLAEEHGRIVSNPYALSEYIKVAVEENNISKVQLNISKVCYFSKIYLLYKMYRAIKRKFGEYS